MLHWAYEHVWTKWKIESHRKETENMKKKQTEILEPIYNINGKQNKQLSGWLNGRKKREEEKSKKVENLNSRNYPIFTTERKKIEKKKKKE